MIVMFVNLIPSKQTGGKIWEKSVCGKLRWLKKWTSENLSKRHLKLITDQEIIIVISCNIPWERTLMIRNILVLRRQR